MPHPRIQPQGWTLRGLSRIALVGPIRASAAAVERSTAFCIPLLPAVHWFYPAVLAARTVALARSLGTHRNQLVARWMKCSIAKLLMQ